MIFHTEHDGFGAQIENDTGMMLRGFEFHCLGVTNKTQVLPRIINRYRNTLLPFAFFLHTFAFI